MDTPILLLIFNRPELTSRVFEEVRKIKPSKLYIAADGPRSFKEGELEKCRGARAIVSKIDWECDVQTLFRESNLGCKMAVSSAITWFFTHETEGIILEDDCVPDPSFFSFCQELLAKYRGDERIMHISGNNFHAGGNPGSYFFSIYSYIWGWATWKRAWDKYNVSMPDFPDFVRQNRIDRVFGSNLSKYSWLYKFWKVYRRRLDTWDYQWTYTIWNNGGMSICPGLNLVSNIGFHAEATHTKTRNSKLSQLETKGMGQLNHPSHVQINTLADKQAEKIPYNISGFKKILYWIFSKYIRLSVSGS